VTENEPSDYRSLEERYWYPLGRFFREHPAVVGSLLYVGITIVGVVYSWTLFKRFGINIFDYAETNDFLFAAFRDPAVFAISIGTLLVASLSQIGTLLAVNFILRRRLQTELAGVAVIRSFLIALVFVLPIFVFITSIAVANLFGNRTADSLLSPTDEPLTSVQYRATSGSDEQAKETDLRVIGTTQSFVFFYDRKDTRTLVIPIAQIVEMERQGPKAESKEGQ
jgi:hypothetical protein